MNPPDMPISWNNIADKFSANVSNLNAIQRLSYAIERLTQHHVVSWVKKIEGTNSTIKQIENLREKIENLVTWKGKLEDVSFVLQIVSSNEKLKEVRDKVDLYNDVKTTIEKMRTTEEWELIYNMYHNQLLKQFENAPKFWVRIVNPVYTWVGTETELSTYIKDYVRLPEESGNYDKRNKSTRLTCFDKRTIQNVDFGTSDTKNPLYIIPKYIVETHIYNTDAHFLNGEHFLGPFTNIVSDRDDTYFRASRQKSINDVTVPSLRFYDKKTHTWGDERNMSGDTRKQKYTAVLNSLNEMIFKSIQEKNKKCIPLLIGLGYSGVGKTSTLIATQAVDKSGTASTILGILPLLIKKLGGGQDINVLTYEVYFDCKDKETIAVREKKEQYNIERDNQRKIISIKSTNGQTPFGPPFQIPDAVQPYWQYIRMAWAKEYTMKEIQQLTDDYDRVLRMKVTESTANNPHSSRSFLLFKIDYYTESGEQKTILVGDLPGQEMNAGIPASELPPLNTQLRSNTGTNPTAFDWNAFVRAVVNSPDIPIDMHVLVLLREDNKYYETVKPFRHYQECNVQNAIYHQHLHYPLLDLDKTFPDPTQRYPRTPQKATGLLLPDAMSTISDCQIHLHQFENSPVGIMEQISRIASGQSRICSVYNGEVAAKTTK